ncbi:hypothetical protein FHW17_004830 [Phyllobacterium sp. P30BS-XVII]|nr:hypothetical protein [Phyllobacterium sp. P30BS-XVII]
MYACDLCLELSPFVRAIETQLLTNIFHEIAIFLESCFKMKFVVVIEEKIAILLIILGVPFPSFFEMNSGT